MSFTGLAQELAALGPWAVAALVAIVLVLVGGAVLSLRVAVRDTPADTRPDIIRAVGDLFRALFGRK